MKYKVITVRSSRQQELKRQESQTQAIQSYEPEYHQENTEIGLG